MNTRCQLPSSTMNRPSARLSAFANLVVGLVSALVVMPTARAEASSAASASSATATPASTASAMSPTSTAATTAAAENADKFERYNRAMYRFNVGVDRAVLRPLAEGYSHLPRPIRGGIGNFVGHLAYADTIVNNFLQGKFSDGGKDLARFTLNTVIGLGGLLDPATAAGLQKNDEDFGQTLGKWGVPAGPYVVLPFLGSSTLRDAPTWAVSNALDARSYIDEDAIRYSLAMARLVDTRASVLVADAAIDQAFDPYAFVRDAYLQRREYKVRDGDVPTVAEEPLEDPAGGE
jgi:phospholipid-binding lipoprotein MlaA